MGSDELELFVVLCKGEERDRVVGIFSSYGAALDCKREAQRWALSEQDAARYWVSGDHDRGVWHLDPQYPTVALGHRMFSVEIYTDGSLARPVCPAGFAAEHYIYPPMTYHRGTDRWSGCVEARDTQHAAVVAKSAVDMIILRGVGYS